MNFTCDICHASRPTSELAPFDLLNLTACRQCVRERQSAPPETCPHCGASLAQAPGGFRETTFACGTAWYSASFPGRTPWTLRAAECLQNEVSTLRFALRDCLPYLSTRRSVGEIEVRERALAVLGEIELEPTEPK